MLSEIQLISCLNIKEDERSKLSFYTEPCEIL